MIDLTPLEVRKKKGDFRRSLRGYEPALVDDFLDLAADRIDQLARENSSKSERLAELERRVGEYRDRERALTDALVTAQEMREEIRAQSAREAELALRTSTQEASARLRDAEQRAETLEREAEQRAETLVRDAELRAGTLSREAEQTAETLVREAEQRAASTLRAAEQGAEDTLRRAQQEADAELLSAQQEVDRLRTDVIEVREREEEALQRLRLHQQQQLGSYRNFLERGLAELEIIAGTLTAARPGEPPPSPVASAAAASEPPRGGLPRDSRAAAAAAVLAQSFLVDDTEPLDEVPFPEEGERFEDLTFPGEEEAQLDDLPFAGAETGQFEDALVPLADPDLEPFEPEPVYEEDLEPRAARVDGVELPATGPTAAAEPMPEPEVVPDDLDTSILLQNAELAGYRLELDEVDGAAETPPQEPELLLEEPADEGGDDDWLSSIIGEKR